MGTTMSAPACHIAASACDKELLSSQLYSDVAVECGDKNWKLHRLILMTRCPFFKNAPFENGKIMIHNQDPEQAYRAIYFIYTAQLPEDVLTLLRQPSTVISTCIDLFALANFFSLDGLRKRAVDVLTEYFMIEASKIQSDLRNQAQMIDIQGDLDSFATPFLEAVRRVYSPTSQDDLQPLKSTLLLYPKLTRYGVLRKELLGDRLRTDPALSGFLADILEETYFRPLEMDKEYMAEECFGCKSSFRSKFSMDPRRKRDFAVCFGDTIIGEEQEAWCRKCKPLGEEHVMNLLGSGESVRW
ncbi:hypothetical protein F5Y10DRAFT_31243 [Nemania abortiva]|nr:hypothetical protein F5Y10DRAFT_31243 [Nemania abortiva]